MEQQYGFPVARADNIFPILEKRGIKCPEKTEPIITLDEYMRRNLTDDEKQDLTRYAPKTEVVIYPNRLGNSFRGFRSVGRDWATVFAILGEENLVPVIGEYKHGADEVTLGLPSGTQGKADATMSDCAQREFQEESCIELLRVIPLSDFSYPVSGRQSTQRCYPYLAEPKSPITKGNFKQDSTEDLRMVLIHLNEWLKLIENGRGIEDCAVSTTFLGLRALGMIPKFF